MTTLVGIITKTFQRKFDIKIAPIYKFSVSDKYAFTRVESVLYPEIYPLSAG